MPAHKWCKPSIIIGMIVCLEGLLEEVGRETITVKPVAAITLEVLVPAYAAGRLGGQIGQAIRLHTLTYFESQSQGSTMLPRLAGFLTREDKAFFELFVTCKGIGYRKAMRAMALPCNQIAAAIVDRDVKMLQTLPEIGKRTAETVVASLRGKVDPFVTAAAYPGEAATAGGDAGTAAPVARASRDALDVFLQLGENRIQAMTWIDQVLAKEDGPKDTQGIVAEVYRLKAGA